MATRTLIPNQNFTAIKFGQDVSDADFATMMQGIIDDYYMPGGSVAPTPPASPRIYPGAFSRSGLLYVPNRGVLQALPGDYVAFDPAGWPILVSSNSITSALAIWTHS